MHESLRAFMSGIIDYAGLFPPASLDMDEAIRNYARYRDDADARMLGRFICPASRLEELGPYHDELFSRGEPFRFSVLARGGDDTAAFISGLVADLEAITSFGERHVERVVVDVFEARLPNVLLQKRDSAELRELLRQIADLVDAHGPRHLSVYYEGVPEGDDLDGVGDVIAGIAQHNWERLEGPGGQTPRYRAAGYKLRCGGVTVDAVPSTELVTKVITACRDAGVLLKATAGLHHPERHAATDPPTTMHGFLNVFGAAFLARFLDLDEVVVRLMIEDELPTHFAFDPDGLMWKDYRIDTAEIAEARETAAASFGSCSFDDPRADLRALGLLKEG